MRLPCFLLFFLVASAPAQTPPRLQAPDTTLEIPHLAPRLRNFSPAEYAAQNQNWSLAQSPEGWLYVGNNAGLLEFDGSRWQLFPLPEKQTVRAVGVGRDGAVFCGGFGEFGFWQNDSLGRFIYHSLSRGIRSGQLAKEEIWHILVRPDFVLFQSFSTIYKFDYRKVTVLEPPAAIMFARQVGDQVLLPVIGRGIYEMTPDNTFRFLPGTEVLSNEIVQFIVPSPDGGLWAGTTNSGMFEWKNGRCQPWQSPLNATFQRAQLNKAERLPDGGWAIGTILEGVFLLNQAGEVRYRLHRENGLQNNTVLALLTDRDNNLWLGLDRGIDLALLHSPLRFFTDHTGRIGTVYTAAFFQNRLFVGTNQGVFLQETNGDFSLVEGSQGQVWQLLVLDRQLLCGHNTGTFAIEGRTARRISEVTGGWCTVRVPGRADLLVQGTYTGLVVFKKTGRGAGSSATAFQASANR